MSFQIVLRAGLIAGLTALPVAALAQTATEAPVTEEDGLPVGQTPVGQTYVAETHGDWEIRCIRAEEGQPEPCQLYQLLVDQNGGPVAEFNVFDLPDEGQVIAGATIVTPLDTLLTPGIRVRVDDGQWSEYPFAFCQQIGCFARLGLTAANVDALRAGGSANVALVPLPAPDQVVQLTASLSGFTAGFAALEARNEAAIALFEQLRAAQGAGEGAASD
ncbi:invasion associated locus B family protein [Roseicyclus persicicus]|uniref:Invasion associated locus B family protein n=1 Tax=Roseicyclus persicicus TaxID=2650661 RepID=A0A7X6H1A1_9RHOB|nr:invasion associated locus B family protein [Roseibacterium persicicum]NKX46202.1 invasion associated locus B family protein [Roseibacterium persicicum]